MKQDFNVTLETKEIVAHFSLDNVIDATVYDHNQLNNRHISDQHPIEAITGLSDTLTDISGRVTTLEGNDHDLGNQVQEIQADVNILKANSSNVNLNPILKDDVDTQIMSGPLEIKKQLDIFDDEGRSMQFGFEADASYIATNNTLDILSPTNFTTAPNISEDKSFEDALLTSLVKKQQVLQAIANKQDTLVSGETIKTINGENLLGSGNLDISDVFIAKYNETPFVDVLNAYNSGKLCFVDTGSTILNLITITNSVARFFGIITGTSATKVTTNINDEWSQVDLKLTISGLPASKVIVSDSSGNLVSSDVTVDELLSLKDINSDITTISGDIASLEADVATIKNSPTYTGVFTDKHGIEADYAIHYGITDCPNGLINYSVNTKEIEIQPGVVIQAAGSDFKTTIGSATKYEVEETGKITLFFTKTTSSSGTTQVGFLEAGDVYYQENEPSDGITSFLAWWQPSKGKWQFKSNYTGNVWREAVATPIANINAGEIGITSVNYIGYRIIDDDEFAQISDIENLQTQISQILSRLDALENK